MSRKLYLLIFTLLSFGVAAQTPSTCFEIESILVDACSNPEGANEMVRFHIGPNPLNAANLTVDWPNPSNAWLGVCQNAGTAVKTDSLNNSVTGCGVVLEPPGGILPPGAQVIIITSEDVQALANSFANLNDTIYVIYQCSGNTAGHFANGSSGSGTRTLSMSFNPPGGGCDEIVTYELSSLVNINGSTGGSSALQNGSSVEYAWDGTATYYNNGCVAPFPPLLVDAGNDTAICPGAALQLNGTDQVATGRFWTLSTQGTFSDATILNPLFTPNANATFPIELILNAYTACDTISDTMLVSRLSGAVSAGADVTICDGQPAQLSGSGSNSYSWATSTGTFVSNQQSPTVNPVATTTYVLTGNFGASNCPDTDTVVVTVSSKDSVFIIASDDTVCAGGSLTLTAAGGTSYLWSPDDGTISSVNIANPSVTPLFTTTYTVISGGACGDTASVLINVTPADDVSITAPVTSVCDGESVQLTATGGSSFEWSPNDGSISDVNIPAPTVTPTATTTYTVRSIGDCPDTAAVQITLIIANSLSIAASDTIVCAGDTVQLTASGGSNYQWSPNDGSLSNVNIAAPAAIPFVTTTYSVISGVCPDTASILITVLPRDTIDITASATSICEGDTVQLTASGASGYQWTPNDGSISDVNSASPTVTPAATATYTVTSSGACAGTASILITVAPFDVLTVTASNTTPCEGETVQLNVIGGSGYQWSPATGLSCTDCADPTAEITDAITYSVTSTGACPSQETISVGAIPLVVISVSNDTSIYIGESVTLNANGGTSYAWSPATGLNTTSGETVIAAPEVTTTYFVTDDGEACVTPDSVTVTILFRECPKAAIPTAFSPNNDSFNDSFGLLNAEEFSAVELRIYNRWGEEVFSAPAGQRWDGRYKGEEQPIGTFAYTITATCENGDTLKLNGCVTLLR